MNDIYEEMNLRLKDADDTICELRINTPRMMDLILRVDGLSECHPGTLTELKRRLVKWSTERQEWGS